MQYALVNGIKTEPSKGLTGTCPLCNADVNAKCGDIKIHHWAHKNIKDCDSWWEPETQWHRDWKNKFPKDNREIPMQDLITKEWHRADVHTNEGITLEFQNSPISITEMQIRDAFYKKLIWIVNADKFKDNLAAQNFIRNPQSPLFDEFNILGAEQLAKKDEYPDDSSEFFMFRYRTVSDYPELNALPISEDLFTFKWKRKHECWFNSTSNVFFDIGKQYLWWLRERKQKRGSFWYMQQVHKAHFIKKYSK